MSSVSAVNSLLSSTTPTTPAISLSSILASVAGASTPGIDVAAAVAAGIYADRAPERGWQADQVTLTSQTTALTAIQTATTALAADLQSLNTLAGPLAARTVSSSNSNYVTATAAAGTVAGVHSVVVNSVASTAGWYSNAEAFPTTPLPASSFTLTNAAGLSKTFTVGGTSAIKTLNDLVAAVTSATVPVTNTTTGVVTQVSLGVSGTIVSDATGSRLAITSNTSGLAADFSITEPFTSWTAPPMPSGDTLGVNSLALTIGTTSMAIATTSGETYAQLATAINSLPANQTTTVGTPPVATTFVTASAATVNGNSTLTIVSTNGTTPFSLNEPSASGTSLGFTQATQGADASLTVDGVPAHYASNTVTGAIGGVTLRLLGATAGAQVSLTVASDASQASTAITQFVTDYNAALGLVNSQFAVSGTSAGQGVLASDPTVRALQSALEQAVSYVNTPATGSTTVSTLRDMGITTGNDGSLSINSAALNGALINSPSDVQDFFEGASLNGFAHAVIGALNNFTSPANGAFKVDLKSFSDSNANLSSQINNFEAVYIASQQLILTAMYSKAEIALQQLPQQMAQLNAELGLTSSSK